MKIDYYLSYYPTKPYTATLVIPVNLPPNSKNTYFQSGLPNLIVNPNGIYGMHLLAGKTRSTTIAPAWLNPSVGHLVSYEQRTVI